MCTKIRPNTAPQAPIRPCPLPHDGYNAVLRYFKRTAPGGSGVARVCASWGGEKPPQSQAPTALSEGECGWAQRQTDSTDGNTEGTADRGGEKRAVGCMAVRASISKCAYGDAARQQASGTQGREARTGREGRTGRKERDGRQVGEDGEDWRTGSKERTGGSSYLPTITCRACCSAGTACSPSTSVATSLSCMRHVHVTCMAVRST